MKDITLNQVEIDSAKRIARLEVLIKLRNRISDLGLTGANQVISVINQWEKGNEDDLPPNCSPLQF